MKKLIFSLVASLVMAGAANAATFNGDLTLDTPFNLSSNGLQLKAVRIPNSGGQTFVSAPLDFDLGNVGDTATLDLFVVRTRERTADADDFLPKAFGLLFSFGQGSVILTGTSYAVNDGVNVFGFLDFDGPVSIALGNAQALVISLSDLVFNAGVGAFTPGKANGALVSASFELVAVPLPATLPLGLGALGLLGFVARRRKAVVQA